MNHPVAEPTIPWPKVKLGRWSGTEYGKTRDEIPDDGEVHFWEEEEFVPVSALRSLKRWSRESGDAAVFDYEDENGTYVLAADLNALADEVNHVS